MIKIIKEGIKEFRSTCPFCYCEFTYEKEDLCDDMIHCPCCGAIMNAKCCSKEAVSTPEIKDNSDVECENHCSNCQFFKAYLLSGKVYVGDSPCQWCQYSGLRVTCTSTDSSVNGAK